MQRLNPRYTHSKPNIHYSWKEHLQGQCKALKPPRHLSNQLAFFLVYKPLPEKYQALETIQGYRREKGKTCTPCLKEEESSSCSNSLSKPPPPDFDRLCIYQNISQHCQFAEKGSNFVKLQRIWWRWNKVILLLAVTMDWWEEAWKCKLERSNKGEDKEKIILGFEILKIGTDLEKLNHKNQHWSKVMNPNFSEVLAVRRES